MALAAAEEAVPEAEAATVRRAAVLRAACQRAVAAFATVRARLPAAAAQAVAKQYMASAKARRIPLCAPMLACLHALHAYELTCLLQRQDLLTNNPQMPHPSVRAHAYRSTGVVRQGTPKQCLIV